jgi:glycosyltransferase involved in cell wall biosynthesis
MATNGARALISNLPAQAAMFSDNRMRRALGEQLSGGGFDVAHVQLARMAGYLMDDHSVPRLVDLIDSLSLNMKRRSARESQPRRFLLREEGRRMGAYESKICASYDAVTVVSNTDRAAIGNRPNTFVNPNGVDLDVFQARLEPPIPDRIIMTGNFGYFPNADGLSWFVEHVLPEVRRRRPNVSVHAVGVDPNREVQRLGAGSPAVQVVGFVPDLAEHLASATVAIVPLRSGSGMQFKVIEAMACGTPVVATSLGTGGLEVVSGRELFVADNPEAFADSICRLMNEPDLRERMARAGRLYVEANFSWEKVVSGLEDLYMRLVTERTR